MSKVFTITEGLENMGAMKTGGQGSIYRAKRIGPIITAVKLLPTPILNEDVSDKNYRDFRNEVEKLKKVNEMPNPNVVRILNFGISETGSFPFIEMEFIEGPDLEELLKAPHDPVFTIKETIRVAEHLANALAHCHRVDVKHGDIKSNNVKFNVHTGNYLLLDFGLALMSDEQRRTSLRHAGAVEFMAPEQSEGNLLFQSDIYSYGVILYELLAGQVPFPLENKNETTRNHVLVAHMETTPPDILPLREAHIPDAWPEERRQHEMQVPQWVLDMIRKCMEKDPAARFANGIELYEYILRHSTSIAESSDLMEMLRQENKKLREEVSFLQQQAQHQKQQTPAPLMAEAAIPRQPEPAFYQETPPVPVSNRKWLLPVGAAILAALVAIFLVVRGNDRTGNTAAAGTTTDQVTTTTGPMGNEPQTSSGDEPRRKGADTVYIRERPHDTAGRSATQSQTIDESAQNGEQQSQENSPPRSNTNHYAVSTGRAYFHNEPDADTRRDAYLTPSDEVFTAIDEEGDFVYIVFTNDRGETSKGWVLKRDLRPVE